MAFMVYPDKHVEIDAFRLSFFLLAYSLYYHFFLGDRCVHMYTHLIARRFLVFRVLELVQLHAEYIRMILRFLN